MRPFLLEVEMSWNFIPETQWVESDKEIIECAEYFLDMKEPFGFDEESSGLNKITDYPILFSMSDGVSRRYAGYAACLKHPNMRRLLASSIPKVGSNIYHVDVHWAQNIDVTIDGPIYDTVVMDWLFQENREGLHGLKHVAYDYCGIQMREFTDVFPMQRATKDRPAETPKEAIEKKLSTKEGFEDAKHYAGLDAFANMKVFRYLEKKLKETPVFVDENGKTNWTLWDHFITFEVPFGKVLYNMERRGIKVSTGYLRAQSIVADKKLKEIEANFHRLMEEKGYQHYFQAPINLNSSAQLKKLFFEIEGNIPTKFTAKNEPSTDRESIENMSDNGSELAKVLLEYKDVVKTKTAFLDGIQEQVCPDGKIHPTYKSITVSGRLSATDPNIQQLPQSAADIFKVRSAFISDEGKVLGCFDYSQLELYLLAHVSSDPLMIEAFNSGKDLHLVAVSLIFGYDYETCIAAKKKEKKEGFEALSDEQKKIMILRTAVKRIWYGLNYGIGDEKLANNLSSDFRSVDKDAKNLQCPSCKTIYPIDYIHCQRQVCCHIDGYPIDEDYINPSYMKIIRRSRKSFKRPIDLDNDEIGSTRELIQLETIQRTVSEKEASLYREKLLGVFKGAKNWLEGQVKLVNEQKQVQSLLGRYRRLKGVDSTSFQDKSRAERQAKNVIQNHASDLMKVVMIAVEEDAELKELQVELLSQIHDELIFQWPEDEETTKRAMKRIPEVMENAFNERILELKCKPKVEGNYGYDWAACK